MYNEQKGCCLGCEIKLISYIFPEERKQYENNIDLISNVDYCVAEVDHDHSMEKPEEYDPNYVRGLLCKFCNSFDKDVLNCESKWYIFGDEGHKNKKILIMEREIGLRVGVE